MNLKEEDYLANAEMSEEANYNQIDGIMNNTPEKEKIQEMSEKLEQGIKDVFESEKYKQYLDVMAKFHKYSVNNIMLIMQQNPNATSVAGYNSWKNNFGRNVKKGETGIKIFAPAPYKMKVTKENNVQEIITVPYFKLTTVFDVSQTQGKPLQRLSNELQADVKNYKIFFKILKNCSPVPITFELIQNANGYYSAPENRIAIKQNMSEAQTIKTTIHEIAHAKLHNSNDIKKELAEVEAESVAYIVCQNYGIDSSDYSFGYLASWSSDKDLKELKSSLEVIKTSASQLIVSIDQELEVQYQKKIENIKEKPSIIKALNQKKSISKLEVSKSKQNKNKEMER